MMGLLLDRYEGSSLSRGTNSRTIHIAQKMTKKEFPEYYRDDDYVEINVIHEQMKELERRGLVTIRWRKDGGRFIDSCILDTDRLADAYDFLGRTPKSSKEQDTLKALEDFKDRLPVFTKWATERLSSGESVRRYIDIDDIDATKRMLALAAAILENTKDQYLRGFSISVFHDSKTAEKEMPKAASILADFERRDTLTGLETDEVLEEFNIYKNPSYVFLKGFGIPVEFSDGIGLFKDDLRLYPDSFHAGIGVPGQSPDVILTIENLTSYHQWNPERHTLGQHELVIYLAGYANHAKREFLRRLHELYPFASFRHFGDIDAGGFRIWKNLAQETGIPITTYCMDLDTFERYEDSGKPLTTNDRKALNEMSNDSFFSEQRGLFSRMLETDTKLEQECIIPAKP